MVRKRTITKSEEFAESIINTVREPLIALDQDLRVVKVSRSFYDFFKVKPEETMGQLIYDLGNHQWDIPKLRELLETILPQKTTFDDYEVEHDFATIGRRTMLLNARQIERLMGKERIILLAIEDITERRRIEDKLTESENRYRRVFETASDGIVLLEKREGKIAYANQAIEKMLGYSLEEAVGKMLQDIGIVDIDDFPTIMQKLNEIGITNFTNVSIKTKSGQDIDTDIYLADRASLVQCNIRDISERVQAHEEQKKLEAQLRRAQRMEAISTLAGGIAHDFNNILSAVMGYAQLAQMELDPESESHADLKEVILSANRAKLLIRQILAIGRDQEQERQSMQFKYIVKEALKLLRSTLPSTIEIREIYDPDGGIINADPTQMHQVIMNLCTNAGHAMQEEGGILEVRLRNAEFGLRPIGAYAPEGARNAEQNVPPGHYLELTVSDTGCGMTPEVMEKIFDPCFTTKEKGEGTGIGLSVVHGIVSQHDGAITVEIEPGKGSTFHVYLPLTQGEQEQPEVQEETPLPKGNERILFIDDEASLANMGKKMLMRLGYDVTAMTSSIKALALFRKDPKQFDLVITDTTMPQIPGDILAQELMKIRPYIPVVISTGHSERISPEKAEEMGIKGFLMKPLNMRVLAETVRKLLDEK